MDIVRRQLVGVNKSIIVVTDLCGEVKRWVRCQVSCGSILFIIAGKKAGADLLQTTRVERR